MARRKGQAALEFLSTYGFAFLLILLMIAALSYFGVLSPQKYLPGRCLVSSEFQCTDRLIDQTTPTTLTFNVRLTNQGGKAINLGTPPANASTDTMFNSGAGCTQVGGVATIPSGGSFEITCPMIPTAATLPPVGEKAKIGFTLYYTELGGAYQRQVAGEVADNIQ